MSADQLDLPQGTLDLLILKTLALESRHGWAISERLHQISSATLNIRQGSLYPALHRLEKRRLLKSSWGLSRNNRRAKYYEITIKGRQALTKEASAWSSFTTAVSSVLTSADRPAWAK